MRGTLSIKSVLEVGSLAPETEGGPVAINPHHPLPLIGAVLGQSRAHSTSADSSLLYTVAICNSSGPGISSPWVSFIFLVLSLLGRGLDWARFRCKGRREDLWGHITSGQSFLRQTKPLPLPLQGTPCTFIGCHGGDKFYIAESPVSQAGSMHHPMLAEVPLY